MLNSLNNVDKLHNQTNKPVNHVANDNPPVISKIEIRSIDYIPRHERHGKIWHQTPFWFTGNFVLPTMVTGFIGPSLGLGAIYSILAIIIGVCFGTFFMAFHANQGPRMGLPQMIQSRAQFGIRGAIVPFIAVVFVYIGFNVFNMILATDAMNTVFPGHRVPWYALFIVIAVLLSIIGHDLLHSVQRYLTYLMIIVFGILTVGALLSLHMDAVLQHSQFSWSVFLVQLSAAAGYQISYAVYVSDYTRYLPEETPASKVIFYTWLGAAASALWLMSLGAFFASALPEPNAISSIQQAGNAFSPYFGSLAVLIVVPSLISIMAVNCYGAMLTSISAIDAFRKITPTLKLRIAGISVIAVLVFIVALTIPESYLESFNNFVLLMLYFLVPWTAVNLVDFYFVRNGCYSINDIFNPNGIYGHWNRSGLIAYIAGLLAMIPFVSLSFYTGPFAILLGGADISFIIGLLVSGIIYALMCRSLDLAAEQKVIICAQTVAKISGHSEHENNC